MLDGPTAFTFVAAEGGDVALAAKALAQFRRENELLEFKGGVMNGEALTAEQIGEIARLPAKDVLYGQVVGMIASPITGLVRSLNALIAGLAIQLKQIADQGLVGGGAEAPAAEAEPAAERGAAAEAEPAAEALPTTLPLRTSPLPRAESASDDDPAEAEQAAQADQAEEEAAQSAEGEETESSSEESAPAGDEAAGEETNESETPSEGDEKE